MGSALKVLFAGTPGFAQVSLAALLESDHKVIGVYTQPDRPAGRGQKVSSSPVKQLALEHGLPVYQPESLKGEEQQQQLKALRPDVLVVVAYGLILPKAVLDIPRYGCVNVHASLLPRWRGAAPIHRALLAGDEETGVTIMQMDEGLDTGDMLMRIPTPVLQEDSGDALHDRLANLGAEALILTLTELQLDRCQPESQDDTQSNYANKIDKSEAVLDWGQSAHDLWNKVRAFNPWPVAQTVWYGRKPEGEILRIWSASVLDDENDESISSQAGTVVAGTVSPGTVVSESKQGIDIVTGDGLLRVTNLQLPGKRAMSSQDFLNAHSVLGQVFGQVLGSQS